MDPTVTKYRHLRFVGPSWQGQRRRGAAAASRRAAAAVPRRGPFLSVTYVTKPLTDSDRL